MGPKLMLVAKHKDGSITITTYTREDEAREAFDILTASTTITDLYMGGVMREMHAKADDRG